jgi:4-amino-4-deoxy-L-arabinose transferase-like glycosyltransferase
MDATAALRRLPRSWWLLLLGFYAIAYLVPVACNRTLNAHDTVHCQNVREMFATGSWLLPTYGGRPWIERGPLPHWITGICAMLTPGGLDGIQNYRIGSIVAGAIGAMLTAWIGAQLFGRVIGLLAGLVLAGCLEFYKYSLGTESDIFLAVLVIAAHALFLRGELGRRRSGVADSIHFLGGRPWPVLACFVVAGMTNLAKGPLFGTFFLAVPLPIYFLVNRDLRGFLRYVWLWGWLAYFAIGCIWPITAWLYCPDALDFWLNDYGTRWNQGYIGQEWWYYLAQLPVTLAPWPIAAFVGLGRSWREATRDGSRSARHILCWGVVPLVGLSFFQGKHHHYMLPCLAPWAILGAVGALSIRDWMCRQTSWLFSPWTVVAIFGGAGDVALAIFGPRMKELAPIVPALLIGWPLLVAATWLSLRARNPRIALVGGMATVFTVHVTAFAAEGRYSDGYRDDVAFVRATLDTVPRDRPLFVKFDYGPLNASWLLFYAGRRADLLHNETYLRDERITSDEVFVVMRGLDEDRLREFGRSEVVLRSRHSAMEHCPEDRWTLFRLHYHPGLARRPAASVSALQATGRAKGPYLR